MIYKFAKKGMKLMKIKISKEVIVVIILLLFV